MTGQSITLLGPNPHVAVGYLSICSQSQRSAMRLAAGDEVRFRCVDTHKFPRFLEEHVVAGLRSYPVQTIARSQNP